VKDYKDTMAFQVAEVFAYRGTPTRRSHGWTAPSRSGMEAWPTEEQSSAEEPRGDARHAALFKRMRLPLAG